MPMKHERRIQDIENILDLPSPAEVDLAEYKVMLSALDADLEKMCADRPEDLYLSVLRGRLLVKLRRWHQAALLWREISQKSSPYKSEAFLALALIHRYLGATSMALNFAAAARKNKAEPSIVKSEIRLINKIRRNNSAIFIIEEAEKLLEKGDFQSTSKMLSIGLDLGGVAPQIITGVNTVLDHANIHNSDSHMSEIHPPKTIFFGGFGWSGSGALVDYLAQHPDCVLPFGNYEIDFFKSSNDLLENYKQNEDKNIVINKIVSYILKNIYGVIGSNKSSLTHWRSTSVIGSEKFHEIIDKINEAAISLIYNCTLKSKEDFENIIKKFIGMILEIKIGQGKIGISGNCISAAHMNIINIVNNSIGVAVFRDPRDQYVAQKYEYSQGDLSSVDNFIKKVKGRISLFENAVKNIESKNIILRCNFEDFVQDDDYRRDFLSKIGFSEDKIEIGEKSYHPKKSMKNIGIYKNYKNQDEIRRIEKEFMQGT